MKFLIVAVIVATSSTSWSASLSVESKWESSLELSVTRCFKSHQIAVKCEDFSGESSKPRRPIQELQIDGVDFFEVTRSYSYGRAIEGPLCQLHLRKIRSLLKGADQVCVSGDGENNLSAKETFARWRGIETKNGKLYW